jgi:hypothetical protein
MLKLWRMRWAGQVAQIGEKRLWVIGGKARSKETTKKTKR